MAATATTTFNVTATVLATCTVSASALGFGNYSATSGTANDATTTISATCNNGSAYTIALDAGAGSGATVAARKMTNGASTLNYALYTTSGRTTVWGDGTASTSTVGGTGNGSAQSLTVYGRIPTSQFVTIGGYTDTITVTLTY